MVPSQISRSSTPMAEHPLNRDRAEAFRLPCDLTIAVHIAMDLSAEQVQNSSAAPILFDLRIGNDLSRARRIIWNSLKPRQRVCWN